MKQSFFKHFVVNENECWIWTAYCTPGGYPRYTVRAGQTFYAHRYSWEGVNGPIPFGHHLDHLCKERRCVNPAHLNPALPKENVRGLGRSKHAFTQGA